MNLISPEVAHILVRPIQTIEVTIALVRPVQTGHPSVTSEAIWTRVMRLHWAVLVEALGFVSAVVTVVPAVTDLGGVDALAAELTLPLALDLVTLHHGLTSGLVLILAVPAVLLLVAHPRVPDAVSAVTLELAPGTPLDTRGNRLNVLIIIVLVLVSGSPGAAVSLVTAIITIADPVTLPPVGDALLGLALEHPLVTLAPGEVGAGQGGDGGVLGGDVCAVLVLVAAVMTVGLSVTLPVAEHAVPVGALELPVVAFTLLVTILTKRKCSYFIYIIPARNLGKKSNVGSSAKSFLGSFIMKVKHKVYFTQLYIIENVV